MIAPYVPPAAGQVWEVTHRAHAGQRRIVGFTAGGKVKITPLRRKHGAIRRGDTYSIPLAVFLAEHRYVRD